MWIPYLEICLLTKVYVCPRNQYSVFVSNKQQKGLYVLEGPGDPSPPWRGTNCAETTGAVSVREQGPVHSGRDHTTRHALGSSVTPTLELRLKMQMGSIPTHSSLHQIKSVKTEKQVEE